MSFNLDRLTSLKQSLSNHPCYNEVRSVEQLRRFMEHHIFSVWDFMSLLKYLQNTFAPSTHPWFPTSNPRIRRFINEIVLEEESDRTEPDGTGGVGYLSHFEMYLEAMKEVGADYTMVERFTSKVISDGIKSALTSSIAPAASSEFMKTTFAFIDTDRPHIVAAAFAFGREHIIPLMFRSLLKRLEIGRDRAPLFHYYLERHIHLDEDHHGPLSLQMVNDLISGDPVKGREAQDAAEAAIRARIAFWDGVLGNL